MKPTRAVLAAVLVLLAPTSLPAYAAPQSAGAAFSSVQHEFGTVKQGEKVAQRFVFRNETATPVTIERVELTGPGMKARFKRVTAPGEQGSVTLEWDTATLKGPAKAEALVHFAGAGQPPVSLVLSGTVQPAVEIQPYAAAFFSTFKGEGAQRALTILNHDERPLTITRLEPEGTHFKASLDTITPGKAYRLNVQVPPGVAPGRYREAVYLYSDHLKFFRIKVPVNVLVKEELYVNPETVDYGSISRAQLMKSPGMADLLTQTFLVKKRRGAFAIKSVTSDVAMVQLKRSPDTGRGAMFQINAGLNKDLLQPGEIKGTIVIETDDPEFPKLTLPVSGQVGE